MLVPNQIVSNNHQRHNLRGQKYFCLFKEGVISLAVVSGLFVAASFYKTAYLFFITRLKPVPDRNLLCKVCLVHGTFMLAALTAAVRGMTPSLLVGIDFFLHRGDFCSTKTTKQSRILLSLKYHWEFGIFINSCVKINCAVILLQNGEGGWRQ